MSKTKNYLMDQEDEFYAIAESEIGNCEHVSEFKAAMEQHKDKVMWTLDPAMAEAEYDDLIGEMWNEFWREYAI